VVLTGSLVESARGASREARRGSVVFKPAGVRHSDRFGPDGARTLQVVLAPGRDVPRYDWVDGGLASGIFLRLDAALAHGDDAARLDAECLVAALLSLQMAPPASEPPPRWLRTVLDFLHAHPDGALHATDLAHLASVHPVHLARVFRRHHGCTIGEYVRRLRLDRAADALAETEAFAGEPGGMSIARIAMEAGFADQAHFTRAFRARAGLPPGRFRRIGSVRPE
jgi:AraC family transcriptional regulator